MRQWRRSSGPPRAWHRTIRRWQACAGAARSRSGRDPQEEGPRKTEWSVAGPWAAGILRLLHELPPGHTLAARRARADRNVFLAGRFARVLLAVHDDRTVGQLDDAQADRQS